MNKMLLIVFFLTMAAAQLGAIPLGLDVTVYSHDIVLGILIVCTLFFRSKKNVSPRLSVPIAMFLVACALSLLVNIFRFSPSALGTSALYALRWGVYACVYLVVMYSLFDLHWWLWGLYGAGSLVAGAGLVQYIWYPSLRNVWYLGWDPHLYRVFSTLLDPNFAAIIFVATLFLGVYLWTREHAKWLIIAGQCVVLTALFLTYSRSGYLAFIVGVVTLAWCMKQGRAAIGVTLCFIALLFFLPRPGGEGVKLLRTVSTFARIGNWQRGMTLIREAPLFGYGFNTLRYVQRSRGWIDERITASKAGAGLDNSFQFVWATTGVIGFGLYVWLIAQIGMMGRMLVAKYQSRTLGAVLLATLSAFIVDSLFSNSLFYPQVMMWLWIIVGSTERLLSSDTGPAGPRSSRFRPGLSRPRG